ncbi:CRISPR-associated endonuclease Cas1 [Corynebacterium sp. MSK006]|nr:CRISPR-associated endonuclease Cas1 [Corynebacterium sp. MSK006]
MEVGVPEPPLPISLVAHTVFCPRRAWLEAAGERSDHVQIQAGKQAHRRVDSPSESRPDGLRSMNIHSDAHGLVGRTDVVTVTGGGVEVTEYKATPTRKTPTVTDAMVVQLALQGLCLTEDGQRVDGHRVYFPDSNKSVSVDIGAEEIANALSYVRQTRKICNSVQAPEPLEDDPRCTACSHAGVCLPDERRLHTVRRRIRVADPDGQVLHVATPGARLSTRQGRVLISVRGERQATVPLERVNGLVLHGNVDVSSALLRNLMWQRITVVWCSSSGRVYGWNQPGDGPNGAARVQQHVASAHGRVDLAREFIAGKIAGQATLLRRNADPSQPAAVASMRELQRIAAASTSRQEIFGVEGSAAALYFGHFATMLRGTHRGWFTKRWPGRSGRGATDPLNSALNYTYALLTAEAVKALIACGLDPHAGFLHSSSRNKPALALDLMEEFRAVIADSCVISCINRGALTPSSFSEVTGTPRLTPEGRKALIRVFENRMNTEFTHPTFGYRVSWRRALEVQARLVLGCLDGTQEHYVAVKTR